MARTIVLPGRWQAPGGPHAGHRYLIDKALSEGKHPHIGIRDTPIDEKNPYDVETRMAQFRKIYGDKVSFFTIPEDGEGMDVWYGRGVGWGIEEVVVPADIVKISGTALRQLERTTIWFTGMPCSGKTTLAEAFKPYLEEQGYSVVLLDGDILRTGLCSGLGFSDEDREENLRRVAHVAELLNSNYNIVLASYVSPTEKLRGVVKDIITNIKMVHVDASAEECATRDVKGMWAKAKAGEIKGFTGYDAPYNAPIADLVLKTTDKTVQENVEELKAFLGI